MKITSEERNLYFDWLTSKFSEQSHVVTPPRFEHTHPVIPAMVERYVWSCRDLVFSDSAVKAFALPTESPVTGDQMFLGARSHFLTCCYVRFDLTAYHKKVLFYGGDSIGDLHIELPTSPRAGFAAPLHAHILPVRLEISAEKVLDEVIHVRSLIRFPGDESDGSTSKSTLTYYFDMI